MLDAHLVADFIGPLVQHRGGAHHQRASGRALGPHLLLLIDLQKVNVVAAAAAATAAVRVAQLDHLASTGKQGRQPISGASGTMFQRQVGVCTHGKRDPTWRSYFCALLGPGSGSEGMHMLRLKTPGPRSLASNPYPCPYQGTASHLRMRYAM